MFMDLEVYRNYFLALFMTEQGKVRRFEIFDGDDSTFNRDEILKLLTNEDVEIVTFNGNNYDVPIITFALITPDPAEIKAACMRLTGPVCRAEYLLTLTGKVCECQASLASLSAATTRRLCRGGSNVEGHCKGRRKGLHGDCIGEVNTHPILAEHLNGGSWPCRSLGCENH
jgi:hypothetical protein